MVAEGVRDQPFASEGIEDNGDGRDSCGSLLSRDKWGCCRDWAESLMISACDPDGEDGAVIFCRNGMGTLSVGTIAL